MYDFHSPPASLTQTSLTRLSHTADRNHAVVPPPRPPALARRHTSFIPNPEGVRA